MEAPLSSMQPCAYHRSNPTLQTPPPPSSARLVVKKKNRKRVCKDVNAMPSKSSSSSSSATSALSSSRLAFKRRSAKVVFAPVWRSHGEVEAIALPLGMSFAAVVAKVLERKDTDGERISVDHLSVICTSAVRESLANVFGDKFDLFTRNFEKSFASTLSTLRLINESSIGKGAYQFSPQNIESSASGVMMNSIGCTSSSGINNCHPEDELPTISIQNRMHLTEEVENDVSTAFLNRELVLHGQVNQLTCAATSLPSVMNQLSIEQARSNDLKTMEIGLTMKKLRLKEALLSLNFDSNHLESSKLELARSKASFKEEKFKTELKDVRHTELLKSCMDCLVAGLFIMSVSLLYGAYVFSHGRITQATASCTPSHEESKSWWIPRPFSSINSELHTLRCQVQVVSRMVFGILMILAVAYLLLQRSATSQQANPITFILLLLGVACGFAGKLCVDTLGGNGSQWFLYWETLCLLQFFSNFWISTLFHILYGPVAISQGTKKDAFCPYWIRRFLFYAIVLLLLPLCCGLLPFASPGEWKDHFLLLATDL